MPKYHATVTVTILDIPAENEDAVVTAIRDRLHMLDVKGGLSPDDGFITEENVDLIERAAE